MTIGICIYSRMITGYHLSFDAPSATSVGMCISHSVLPKENWLALHQVDAHWPVFGVMDAIHVDNGADFRSKALRRACEVHGITIDYRPIKKPRFGGHVERFFKTINDEIHDLPGSTYSNVQQKGEYNSEKEACMTLEEMDTWVVTWICNVYHQAVHSKLGLSPYKKWEIGVLGNATTSGAGVRPLPQNRINFQIDFLPGFERTIQRTGVEIDRIRYYSDTLRRWVNALDPDKPDRKRKFRFKRDPRNVSVCLLYTSPSPRD